MTTRQTGIGLVIAAVGPAALTLFGMLIDLGTVPLWLRIAMVLLVLACCLLAGLLIVFPLLIWFPLLRQPSWAVGTAAGVVLAWFPLIYGRLHDGLWDRWQALVFTTLAGASWGVVYVLYAKSTRGAPYTGRSRLAGLE
jgi:hypothetical protein